MIIPFDTLNTLVAFGAILLEFGAIFLFGLLYFRSRSKTANELSSLVSRFGLLAGLILTLLAFFMSLYYSEILGFKPCGLCWTIRIFTYSQVFIFAIAFIKKDHLIVDYIIALSLAGLFVGLYQHYLQMGGAHLLPCPATTGEVDCADRFLFEFGHVTFPWVGAMMFLFLIGVALHIRVNNTVLTK